MPQFLAKDYLSEHLNANLRFLAQTLLVPPNHLDLRSDYLSWPKNEFIDAVKESLQDKFEFDHENFELDLCHTRMPTVNVKGVMQLEIFDVEDAKKHDNIIQIDSDSDCEFPSSFNSSVASNFNDEIFKSVTTPSICTNEMKDGSETEGFFLEEFEDLYGFQQMPMVSKLCKWLRHVRVADPFAFKTCNKIDIEKFLVDESTLDSNESDSFKKVEFNQSFELLLIEDTLDCDSAVDSLVRNDVVQQQFCNLLETLQPVELTEETEKQALQPLLDDRVNHLTTLEQMLKEDCTSNEQDHLNKIPLSESTQTLDSPCSEFGDPLCSNCEELSGLCHRTEEVEENDKIIVISPHSTERLLKKVWDEDKVFGDLLLMLLPDHDEKPQICIQQMVLPVNELKNVSLNQDFDLSLDWDPMSHAELLMESSKQSIVEKMKSCDEKPLPLREHMRFSHVAIDAAVSDSKIEDWKLEERKLQSLKYITSYKIHSAAGDGIPLTRNNILAPVGYHKPVYQDRTNVVSVKTVTSNATAMKSNKSLMMTSTPKNQYQSPLDSFMLLRTGKMQSKPTPVRKTAIVAPVASVSAAKVKPMMRIAQSQSEKFTLDETPIVKSFDQNFCTTKSQTFSNQEMKLRKNESSLSMTMQKAKGEADTITEASQKCSSLKQVGQHVSKNHPIVAKSPKTQTVVDIKLSKEYQNLIASIDQESWSLLQFLKDSKCVDKSVKFLTLSPDMTRFLVKEEFAKNRSDSNGQDILRGVLCVHALVTVVDLVVHSDIPTACAVLKSYNLEHKLVLRNCLEPVRKKLSLVHCRNEDRQEHHPKFLRIENMITNWLNADSNSKVLVLVGRYFQSIAPRLQGFLCDAKSIIASLYPGRNASQEDYMNTFYKSNVIVAQENEDLQSCPWEYFQFVIQYEHRSASCWHEMAFNGNTNLHAFVSLNVLTDTASATTPVVDDLRELSDHGSIQHTVLCSKQVIIDKDLLVALERRENVKVLVKSYEILKPSNMYHHHPDVLIDERTALVIFKADDLDSMSEEILCKKILSVVLKSCFCHVIVVYKDISRKSLSKPLSFIASILIQVRTHFTHITCKLWHVYSSQQLAEIIRSIADEALSRTKVWTKEQWTQRSWVQEDFMKEEQFLLAYPFINSFCAQIMIQTQIGLKALLQFSYEELRNCLDKWIPEYFLVAFYRANHYVRSNTGTIAPSSNQYFSPSLPHNYFTHEPLAQALPIEELIDYEDKQTPNSGLVVDKENVINFERNYSVPARKPDITLQTSVDPDGVHFVNHNRSAVYKAENSKLSLNKSQISSGYASFSFGIPSSPHEEPVTRKYGGIGLNASNNLPGVGSSSGFSLEMPTAMNDITNKPDEYARSNRQHALFSKPMFTANTSQNSLMHQHYQEDSRELFSEHFHQNELHSRPVASQRRPASVVNRHFDRAHGKPLNKSGIRAVAQKEIDQLELYPSNFHPVKPGFNNYCTMNNASSGLLDDQMMQLQRSSARSFNENSASDYFKQKSGIQRGYETPGQAMLYSDPPRSVLLSSNKKRRLTYERVPGANNGQTRLTFF